MSVFRQRPAKSCNQFCLPDGWCCVVFAMCCVAGAYTPDLGRTPMAAKDPTLLNVSQSVAYESRDGDKPAEQQKKSGWFPW